MAYYKNFISSFNVGFHMYCAKIKNDFEGHNNKKEESFFRIINEIPTILFILIVLLVVFKPFD